MPGGHATRTSLGKCSPSISTGRDRGRRRCRVPGRAAGRSRLRWDAGTWEEGPDLGPAPQAGTLPEPEPSSSAAARADVAQSDRPTRDDDCKTHCPAGRPYEDANTYVNRKGWRSCRACQRDAKHRRRARKVKTLTPEQRVLRSRLGAYRLHATHDPKETTRNARAAFASRFERQVDPDGVLAPAERARRAEAARRAYFTHLALLSSRARRRGG